LARILIGQWKTAFEKKYLNGMSDKVKNDYAMLPALEQSCFAARTVDLESCTSLAKFRQAVFTAPAGARMKVTDGQRSTVVPKLVQLGLTLASKQIAPFDNFDNT
jgi:hypothetical protein